MISLALAASLCAPVPADDAPGLRPWTFLIYAAVDNNAEVDGNFFSFLDGVRGAFADDPGVEVVLFIDRAEGYSTNTRSLGEDFTDARLYRVRQGSSERLAGGEQFPEITKTSTFEPDSADPINVRKFLAFGKAAFPAQRYALMLYGHADGRAMCPDEQSGHEIGFAQLTDVVSAKESVDLMALELCNMCGVEIGYQWSPTRPGAEKEFSTRVLLAIPNAGPPLDWGKVFAKVRTPGRPGAGEGTIDPAQLDAAAFGKLIVDEGGRARAEAGEDHEAVAALDLARAPAVKRAIDALAVELAAPPTADARLALQETMELLRGPAGGRYVLNYGDNRLTEVPYVDMHALFHRAADCGSLSADVRAAAVMALRAIDGFVIASWGGKDLEGFEPGASGVFIVFPQGDANVRAGGTAWKHCDFYTPLECKGVYGRLAWCRDGATPGNGKVENWFELLDAWYDDVDDGPEGCNRYAY